jgi:hypothetical protein
MENGFRNEDELKRVRMIVKMGLFRNDQVKAFYSLWSGIVVAIAVLLNPTVNS